MWPYKTVLKILAVPAIILLTMVQWLLVLLIGFSSVLLYGLSVLFLAIAGIFYLAGAMSGGEIFSILLAAFVFFMLPIAGVGISVAVAAANAGLRIFVMS